MAWRRRRPLDVTELLAYGKTVTMGNHEYRVVQVVHEAIDEVISINLVSQARFDQQYRIPGGTT